MPTCKKCGRYGNVLTVDACPYCNAKDWDTDLYKGSQSKSQHGLGCAGLGVVALLWLALVLGGLWLLVLVVKWMWQHS
jgi:hypothetical protein